MSAAGEHGNLPVSTTGRRLKDGPRQLQGVPWQLDELSGNPLHEPEFDLVHPRLFSKYGQGTIVLVAGSMTVFELEQPDVLMAYHHLGDFPGRQAISHAAAAPHLEYEERIRELLALAGEDGIVPNIKSEKDFKRFVTKGSQRVGASLALLDNGNLRATWDEGDDQVSLEFCGDGAVEYVVIWKVDDSFDGRSDRCEIDAFWAAYNDMDVRHVLSK